MNIFKQVVPVLVLFLVMVKTSEAQSPQPISLSNSPIASSFELVKAKTAATIYIDSADAKVVNIAAHCFAKDIQSVTGVLPSIQTSGAISGNYTVIAGTIGHSKLIDGLITKQTINISKVKGQWETFSISVVNNPAPGIKQALVIAGSDRRGTAYGFFELSRMMGVSPYVWWADVAPQHHDEIYIHAGTSIIGPPSVKFRGIFLNDEDWGLQPWAAKNMDKDIKDIGPNTYAHIFELLLRLKANYIWPAMHPCTKAFWYYKENPAMADRFAIVLGASHCEPILRDNVFEWSDNYTNEFGQKPGEWRYDVNKQQIYPYWEARVNEAKNMDAVYTVGMRGIHDGSMPGPKDKTEKVHLLESIIGDQREMLSRDLKLPADQIPQIFCPYKEVLDLYQDHMKLPDDVSIVWADDNHGYIRQVSNPTEQKRSGGSGVYYHVSYWGAPHDYLWIESISPSLISYEMSKAYRFGANKVWILNVGDLKPAECETQFFLDLAWNINSWPPDRAYQYAEAWATETFGAEFAKAIAHIKTEYYRLAASAKPEHTNAVNFSEAQLTQRLADYKQINDEAVALAAKIPASLKDAYFELIQYPVQGAKLMNEKIYYAQKSLLLGRAGQRAQAADYATLSRAAYQQIHAITAVYNASAHGKWNGIMSDHPRDQKVFEMPPVYTDSSSLKISVQPYLSAPYYTIDAADFSAKKDAGQASITTINGLGISGKAVTAMPIIQQSFLNDLTQAPYIEYNLNLKEGDNQIKVKCLPTFHLYDGLGLHYALSVNGETPTTVNIDAPADGKVWGVNVLQGFSQGATSYHAAKTGAYTVRVYLPDPGVVLSSVEVYN